MKEPDQKPSVKGAAPLPVKASPKLNVKTCAASAATRGQRVFHNLELRPYELLGEIHLAALQEVERRRIEYNSCAAARRLVDLLVNKTKNRVIFPHHSTVAHVLLAVGWRSGEIPRQCNKTHQVLEPVTATALDLDAQGQVWVVVALRYLPQARGGTRRDVEPVRRVRRRVVDGNGAACAEGQRGGEVSTDWMVGGGFWSRGVVGPKL